MNILLLIILFIITMFLLTFMYCSLILASRCDSYYEEK